MAPKSFCQKAYRYPCQVVLVFFCIYLNTRKNQKQTNRLTNPFKDLGPVVKLSEDWIIQLQVLNRQVNKLNNEFAVQRNAPLGKDPKLILTQNLELMITVHHHGIAMKP